MYTPLLQHLHHFSSQYSSHATTLYLPDLSKFSSLIDGACLDWMDQDLPGGHQAGNGYAISGKIMLSAVVILFAVVIFMASVHLYARWYFLRQRRRRLESRQGRGSRAQIVLYAENNRRGAAVANRGLRKEVLNSLPFFDYSAAAKEAGKTLPECAVCLQDFEGDDVVRLLPTCGHSFHIECIDMWFSSHSTCPLCRAPVESAVKPTESTAAVVVEVAEEVNQPEQSSGSDSVPEATRQHQHEATSLSGRRKPDGGMRIEVAPARWAELEIDLSQSSPGSRFLYLKRLLSMSIKSPIGSACGSSHGAGTSGTAAAEMDIESGFRVQTPR